jgi:hypothetical protein
MSTAQSDSLIGCTAILCTGSEYSAAILLHFEWNSVAYKSFQVAVSNLVVLAVLDDHVNDFLPTWSVHKVHFR